MVTRARETRTGITRVGAVRSADSAAARRLARPQTREAVRDPSNAFALLSENLDAARKLACSARCAPPSVTLRLTASRGYGGVLFQIARAFANRPGMTRGSMRHRWSHRGPLPKIALRYVFVTVAIFALAGVLLEFSALFVAIAFTGVKGFGPHWGFAAIYCLGLWPDQFLPFFPASSSWANLYLIAPVAGWGLIGFPIGAWIAYRRASQS